MKFIASLFFLPFLVHAAEPTALHCSDPSSRLETTLTLGASGSVELHEKRTIRTIDTDEERILEERMSLEVLGTATIGMRDGLLEGVDPVIGLITPAEPGLAYVNIESSPAAATDTRRIHYVIRHASREVDCTEGAQMAALDKLAADRGSVSGETLKEYWDSSLALSCDPIAAGGERVRIRAHHNGFGESSIQVVLPGDPRWNALDQVEDAAPGLLLYTSDPREGGSSELRLQTTPDATGNYAATFRKASVPMELRCQKRWSFDTAILQPVLERASAPRSLPVPVGARADIDSSFCTDGGFARAQAAIAPYRNLLSGIDGVVGSGFGMAEASVHPSGVRCVVLSMFVGSQEEIATVQARIGESFLGVMVQYGVMGVIEL